MAYCRSLKQEKLEKRARKGLDRREGYMGKGTRTDKSGFKCAIKPESVRREGQKTQCKNKNAF